MKADEPVDARLLADVVGTEEVVRVHLPVPVPEAGEVLADERALAPPL